MRPNSIRHLTSKGCGLWGGGCALDIRGVHSAAFTLRLTICGDETNLPRCRRAATGFFLWRRGAHDEQRVLTVITAHWGPVEGDGWCVFEK